MKPILMNGNIVYRQCAVEEVVPLMADAVKEGLTFIDGVIYFGAFDGDKIVACSGLKITGDKVFFKSSFVTPEYRGIGIYKTMVSIRYSFIAPLGCKKITAYCTKMSYPMFQKLGFSVVKQYSKTWKVEKDI